jgi:hypothetical protein
MEWVSIFYLRIDEDPRKLEDRRKTESHVRRRDEATLRSLKYKHSGFLKLFIWASISFYLFNEWIKQTILDPQTLSNNYVVRINCINCDCSKKSRMLRFLVVFFLIEINSIKKKKILIIRSFQPRNPFLHIIVIQLVSWVFKQNLIINSLTKTFLARIKSKNNLKKEKNIF